MQLRGQIGHISCVVNVYMTLDIPSIWKYIRSDSDMTELCDIVIKNSEKKAQQCLG